MSYGFQAKNPSGFISIDDVYTSYYIRLRGTVIPNNYFDFRTVLTNPGDLLLIRPAVFSSGKYSISDDIGFTNKLIVIGDSFTNPVEYAVASSIDYIQADPAHTSGLNVYKSSGGIAFTSQAEVLSVTSIANLPGFPYTANNNVVWNSIDVIASVTPGKKAYFIANSLMTRYWTGGTFTGGTYMTYWIEFITETHYRIWRSDNDALGLSHPTEPYAIPTQHIFSQL